MISWLKGLIWTRKRPDKNVIDYRIRSLPGELETIMSDVSIKMSCGYTVLLGDSDTRRWHVQPVFVTGGNQVGVSCEFFNKFFGAVKHELIRKKLLPSKYNVEKLREGYSFSVGIQKTI